MSNFENIKHLADVMQPGVLDRAYADIHTFNAFVKRLGEIVTPQDTPRLLLTALTGPVKRRCPWAATGYRLECYEERSSSVSIGPVFISFQTPDGIPIPDIQAVRLNANFLALGVEMRNLEYENSQNTKLHKIHLVRENPKGAQSNSAWKHHVRFWALTHPLTGRPGVSATAATMAVPKSDPSPPLARLHPHPTVPRPTARTSLSRFAPAPRQSVPDSEAVVSSRTVPVMGAHLQSPPPPPPETTLEAVRMQQPLDGLRADTTPRSLHPMSARVPRTEPPDAPAADEVVYPLSRRAAPKDKKDDELPSHPHSA